MTTNAPRTIYTLSIETANPDLASRVALAIAGAAPMDHINSTGDITPGLNDRAGLIARVAEIHEELQQARAGRADETARANKAERNAASDRSNLEHLRTHAVELQSQIDRMLETDSEKEIQRLTDALRVADADRAPLRMDLDNANAEIKRLRARLVISESLTAAAQIWEGPYRSARSANDFHVGIANDPSNRLLDAVATFEREMTALVDQEAEEDIPF